MAMASRLATSRDRKQASFDRQHLVNQDGYGKSSWFFTLHLQNMSFHVHVFRSGSGCLSLLVALELIKLQV